MKVVFLKDALPHGRKGQLKEVSDGFASNFLIPKSIAAAATKELQAKLEKESREHKQKLAKEKGTFSALKTDMEKKTFTLKAKVGGKGQIFGGIHEKEIAQAVNEIMKTSLDKSQVKLMDPIKQLGHHSADINLGHGLTAKINIHVEAKE